MNLSLGERPVKAPVRTETAPSAVSWASRRSSASATNWGAMALTDSTLAPSAIVWRKA